MKAYRCIKTVLLDGSNNEVFTKGKDYFEMEPDAWPDDSPRICLKDNTGEPHFMPKLRDTDNWTRKHFTCDPAK